MKKKRKAKTKVSPPPEESVEEVDASGETGADQQPEDTIQANAPENGAAVSSDEKEAKGSENL